MAAPAPAAFDISDRCTDTERRQALDYVTANQRYLGAEEYLSRLERIRATRSRAELKALVHITRTDEKSLAAAPRYRVRVESHLEDLHRTGQLTLEEVQGIVDSLSYDATEHDLATSLRDHYHIMVPTRSERRTIAIVRAIRCLAPLLVALDVVLILFATHFAMPTHAFPMVAAAAGIQTLAWLVSLARSPNSHRFSAWALACSVIFYLLAAATVAVPAADGIALDAIGGFLGTSFTLAFADIAITAGFGLEDVSAFLQRP